MPAAVASRYEARAEGPPSSPAGSPAAVIKSVQPGILLQGRWRVSRESAIFDDAVSTIYKARDIRESKDVALKVYRNSGPLSLQKFRKSVELLLTFRGRFTRKGARVESNSNLELLLEELRSQINFSDYATAHSFISEMNFRSSFVELISYSHDKDWMPAPDPSTGLLFIVMELGETSLKSRMTDCVRNLTTLTTEEIRSVHWSLVTIVCGLHTEGFMHLDIKPSTLFRYTTDKGKQLWKLVDLDGAVKTGSQVRAQDLIYKPEYTPPELAQLFLKCQREGGRMKLSRCMNVWSAGMVALETVSLMPAFDVKYSWYQQWREKSGGKNRSTLLAAIAGEQSKSLGTEKMITPELHEAMAHVSEDMAHLVASMLVKDVKGRSTIARCLLHRWFASKRRTVLDERWRVDEDEDADLPGINQVNEQNKPTEQEDVIGTDIRAYIKAQIARNEAEKQGLAPEAVAAATAAAAAEAIASRKREEILRRREDGEDVPSEEEEEEEKPQNKGCTLM